MKFISFGTYGYEDHLAELEKDVRYMRQCLRDAIGREKLYGRDTKAAQAAYSARLAEAEERYRRAKAER